MFFARNRKKATAAATTALRVLVAANQFSRGISTFSYYDPYVLGYLTATAFFYAKTEVGPRLKPLDLGFAVQESFTNVCNVNGVEMAQRSADLFDRNDPEFLRGSDDATTLCLYTNHLLEDERENRLVREAAEVAKTMGSSMFGGDPRAAVGGALMMMTFNRRIKELRGDFDHA